MPTGRQHQHGSVFMGMLVTVAVVAVMLMEAGTLWSSVLQRERELELLARGNEIRRAIGLYYAHGSTFPRSLEDLVLDRRQPTIKRYLRRVYTDPLTGNADWGVVPGPAKPSWVYSAPQQARPSNKTTLQPSITVLQDKAVIKGGCFCTALDRVTLQPASLPWEIS
ncbi:pilus assembly FimT family protein [Pseudomonas cyclaminis]|uniref:pilus assembly FimT family protein n=1 Tax=Pseudomonas cyclaminis TaxID=2781239 RepID=UPI001FE9F188|nr:type II secretion system protein [Pseudomonas cyclaminis]